MQSFVAKKLVETQHEFFSTLSRPQKHQSTLISNEGLIGIEIWENFHSAYEPKKLRFLTFDMNRKQFELVEINVHQGIKANLLRCDNLVWRDQIYHPVLDEESNLTDSLEVITISKSLIETWDEFKNKTSGCRFRPEASGIQSGENRPYCCSLAVKPRGFLNQRRIWGDDDLIVLFDGHRILSWQFTSSPRVPF